MSRLEQILEQMQLWAAAPAEAARIAKAAHGGKAIGCMPEYCPEELVTAAGMLPLGLWGGAVELSKVKRYFPGFFCAPIQQTLELAMSGAFDGLLSGVLVPILCDALKSAGQNWRLAVPHIPMLPFVYPQNRQLDAGISFLTEEYRGVLKKLEEISGATVTDEALERAIAVHNRCRAALRAFAEEAPKHLDIITPAMRHAVLTNVHYSIREPYAALVEELTALLRERPVHEWKGMRIAVTGILLDSPALLGALAEHGIAVVGDNLAQETRQLTADVPAEGKTPLERIALRWRLQKYCSLAVDEKKERAALLADACANGADGVLVCLTSFCDPEEYDYPILRAEFERRGVRHILIEVNDTASVQQAITQIQAFSELLTV